MKYKAPPKSIHLLPDNRSLWLRSLVSTSIAAVCVALLTPVFEELVRRPEYWLGVGSGKPQAAVAFSVCIFGPIFLVINAGIMIWNKNSTKRNIQKWGDMVVEDEDTHYQV